MTEQRPPQPPNPEGKSRPELTHGLSYVDMAYDGARTGIRVPSRQNIKGFMISDNIMIATGGNPADRARTLIETVKFIAGPDPVEHNPFHYQVEGNEREGTRINGADIQQLIHESRERVKSGELDENGYNEVSAGMQELMEIAWDAPWMDRSELVIPLYESADETLVPEAV